MNDSDLRTDQLFVEPRQIHANRTGGDRIYRRIAGGGGALTFLVLFLIGLLLLSQALPALRSAGWSFLTTQEWAPTGDGGTFGISAVLYWTVVISMIAMVMAVPVAIAASLFITEIAPARLRRPLTSLVDLLAAVPSLIYGLWGRDFLMARMIGPARFLADHFGWIPIFRVDEDAPVTTSAFIAGTVLAIMVLPICTAVIREVFSQTPPGEKEAALALGATRWGMIRTVVLPFGKGGIIGGSMLGLGRALGETIAVALLISPVFLIRPNILQSGANSVASLIALRFSEASGTALSALMAAGLALFAVTLAVNAIASRIVSRSRSGRGVEI